jgi:hypothetical protein
MSSFTNNTKINIFGFGKSFIGINKMDFGDGTPWNIFK